MRPLQYESVFISDVHLGTRDAKTEFLRDFLIHTESKQLYLVGDILDLWKLRSGWHWPEINNEIVRLVMAKARAGTRVVYVPGNHDDALRDYDGAVFGGVRIATQTVHRAADGRRYLVLHGDEFDCVVMNARWLADLGSRAYALLLRLNRWLNVARRRLGFPYWSVSAYLKHRVKEAVNYIGSFRDAVVRAAREQDVHGVICGHIHHGVIETLEGITYANTGDWVESCTALVEHADGRLGLVRWVQESAELLDARPADANSDRDGRVVSAG